MIIPSATSGTLTLDAMKRSRYQFGALTQKVERREVEEPLIGAAQLRRSGILVEPFWEDGDDLEGNAYRNYMSTHSDFDLAIRSGVYERIIHAQRKLPVSWRIVLKAGYRPLEVQYALLAVFANESRLRFPERTETDHHLHARTFVSDPDLVCPPHVTGGAIDVDIKDIETGAYIDMGCPPNTDSEISFLHSDLITPRQYKNRMVLLDAMLDAGFAPNPHEWWHYQYGETYWAAFYGHMQTRYDMLPG